MKNQNNAASKKRGFGFKIFKNKSVSYNIVMCIVFVIFAAYAVSLIAPFMWMLLNSFKDQTEFIVNISGWPQVFTFKNYTEKILIYESVSGQNIFEMFGVSALVTVLGVIINILLSSMAAYVIAKYKFPGRSIIYGVAVFTLVVPIVGTLPAQVMLMDDLMLLDTLPGLLFLYSGAFGLNFILLHGFFSNLSWAYAESAKIDGANDFQIFFLIMLPLSKGAIIAVAILHAIGLWNDYSTPLIFMPSLSTLAVGLDELQQVAKLDYPTRFAAVIIAVIPMLVVFIIFQRTIIDNVVAGGLKG